MSVVMPGRSANIPEPDPKSNESEDENLPNVQQFQVDGESSSEDENEPENQGYEPLPMVEGVVDDINISSDEETTDLVEELPKREIDVNTDLVKTAMKSIKLDESSIPSWARDISDSAWASFVKQAVLKDSDMTKECSEASESSSLKT